MAPLASFAGFERSLEEAIANPLLPAQVLGVLCIDVRGAWRSEGAVEELVGAMTLTLAEFSRLGYMATRLGPGTVPGHEDPATTRAMFAVHLPNQDASSCVPLIRSLWSRLHAHHLPRVPPRGGGVSYCAALAPLDPHWKAGAAVESAVSRWWAAVLEELARNLEQGGDQVTVLQEA